LFTSVILFSSCSQSKSNFKDGDLNHEKFTSKRISDISILKNQIIIAGSANHYKEELGIQSPFISSLDNDLNIVHFEFFKTETTARNIQLVSNNKQECTLAYYAAKSIENQEEETTIYLLDENWENTDKLQYGYRTRIKDIVTIDNSNFVTLNYERSTQKISIKYFKHFDERHSIKISEGEETNIPTDLILLPKRQLALSGIANGFHYLDGHDYKSPAAHSFIITLDEHGNELNSYTHKSSGHSFIYDMIVNDNHIVLLGNQQNENTGMDLIFGKLDLKLNIIIEKQIYADGIQEGHSIIFADESYFLYGTTEDLNTHKMMLQLVRVDKNGEIIWERTYGKMGASNAAIDIVFFDSHLILLSQSKELRTSTKTSNIQKISLNGNVIAQMDFN